MIERLNPWVRGKRVLILGFGREGRSTWQVLKKLGTCACLDVADQREIPFEEGMGKRFFGPDYQRMLSDYDVVFKSPGIVLEEPPEKAHVKAILDPLLERLEEHYGVKPILYVTYRSYYRYIAGGGYGDYPIWCSSPTIFPLVPGWDFWQYSHSARLEGYDGAQDRIDLNIFRGSRAEFEQLGRP